MKRRILAALLALVLVLSGAIVPTKVKALTPEEEAQILAQRRDIAEAHMRQIVSMIWRCEVDMQYTMNSSVLPETASENFTLRAGRLYRGLPYSFSGGSLNSWKDLISEPDENGVYTASDLNWQAFSGGSTVARFGTDCSGAVSQAWSQIGASTQFQATASMTPSRGYLRVGQYVSSNTTIDDDDIKNNNTDQTMYAAYAQLQKADALVHDGHVRMAVSVDVVYEEDGVTINGEKSTVTILEQGRGPLRKDSYYYDETLGENVYEICGVDVVVTFQNLYSYGYRPITCDALIDATAGTTVPAVTDSLSSENYSFANLLSGTLTTKNWAMDTVTMTITDKSGKTVQEAMITAPRSTSDSSASRYKLPLSRFTTEAPTRMLGYIAPDVLSVGDYHCELVCRLTTGQEFTVRDFDFKVTTTKNDIYKTQIDFTQGTVHDCPMCGTKDAQWKPLTTAHVGSGNGPSAGHYYLTESMENNASYIAISGVKVCLHLNGKNISSKVQALSLSSSNDTGAVLNIMGEGVVSGHYPSTDTFGAALHVSESTANLYGGTYRRDAETSNPRPIVDIRGSGKINMYEGARIEGNKSLKRSSVLIYKGRFNMFGGVITDGYGTNGGNVLVGYNNAYNLSYLCMYGGKITNGTGTGMGGNIYGVYDSFVYIHGGEVTGGNAANGGNLAVNKGANIRITGGIVTGGSASGLGDGIYATNTTTKVTSKTEIDESTGALKVENLYLQDCGAIIGADARYEGETYAENNAFIKIETPAPAAVRGDMNDDGVVTDADALYLLRYTLFEDRYPISQSGDVNGDGDVTDADALYLLRFTLFSERYPLS